MNFRPNGANPNLIVRNEAWVYDDNKPGDNFRVFSKEQAGFLGWTCPVK